MNFFAIVTFILGGVAAYIGLENIVLYSISRNRLHLWVGLLGICHGLYSGCSYGLNLSQSLLQGATWQLLQIVIANFMFVFTIFLSLDHLGKLRRVHYYWVLIPAIGLSILHLIPGVGLTQTPAIKQIPWLDHTIYEMELGPSATVAFLLGLFWMGYVIVLLVKNAIGGSRTDRIIAGMVMLWFIAAANDMLVSFGVYTWFYMVEYVFFIVVLMVATLLVGEQHMGRRLAEAQHKRLAKTIVDKEHDLAITQAELTEAAKLAAVGRLAAGVAHEVNNPLTYVIGNLQLLENELQPDEELFSLAREAMHGANRIKKVVRQLSGFARADAISQAAQLEVALDSAARMAMAEIKDRAELQVEVPDLPLVAMDEGQLAQVLLNLLVNAAQSIPPGNRDANCILVQARLEENYVTLLVEDTGKGISKEALPHIFEPFFTTKEIGEGEGLGLSICNSLIKRAGGAITAHNSTEGGACFTIKLPIFEADADAAPLVEQAEGNDPLPEISSDPQRKLLLVDDDEDVLRVLQRTLCEAFQIQTARSGKEALEILETNQSFDLILCDLMMPEGSGLDVLNQLGARHPELVPRVILMTGGAPGREKEALAKDPSVPVLEKPFLLEDLLTLLQAKDSPSPLAT